MVKQRILYLFLFLLAFGNISKAQKTNPFEINRRQEAHTKNKKSDISEKAAFEINQNQEKTDVRTNNPFDINKKFQKRKVENLPENTTTNPDKTIKTKYSGKKIFDKIKSGQKGNLGFLHFVILFILVYVALLLSINRALILKIFKSLWFYNLTNILFRNFVSREFVFYLFLFLNFVLNLSTFVYLVINKKFGASGFDLWGILFISVLAIYILKHFFIYLFENIFPTLKSLSTYNFTVLLFNISLGFTLLPLNLIIAYSFESLSVILIYFAIIIIIAIYVLRFFRGFLITYNYFINSIFHFFLYLCAFEILPLIFLYKIIIKNL